MTADELRGEVEKLSHDILDARHESQVLAKRADALEKFHDKVEPNMWFVTGAKAIVGLFAVAVVGAIVSGAYWLGALNSNVAHRAETLAKLATSSAGGREQLVKLEAIISHQNQEATRLEKAIDKLEARLVAQRFVERTAYNPGTPPAHYHEHAGKLGRLGKDSITLEEASGQMKVEYTYPLDPGARVLIKGKGAKVEDLKPGMLVRLWHNDGNKVQLVESVEELPRLEPAPNP